MTTRKLLPLCLALVCACAAPAERGVRIARLAAPGGDPEGFAAVRRALVANNPGYDLRFHGAARGVAAATAPRVVFVQNGEARAVVEAAASPEGSDVTVGDIVLLRPGEVLAADAPLDLVAFSLPEPLPADLPTYVRPDWDPGITDTPGGCATETGAYRRILLTWLADNGPYLCHALNAHRVRITDSFTHYHPADGGFDELYLVQMVQPGARLLTSEAVDAIEARAVSADEVPGLFHERGLRVGDLVYLPRGTIHRGLGGVLAQVITIPGFRPGAEIGVDHHLRAINEKLNLRSEEGLPYHRKGSQEPIVR
ncbi:MAG: hypothetical protein AAF682_01645 [Planctomycetota bacterium]